MGDQDNLVNILQPKVGQNYQTPTTIEIPAGTVYQFHSWKRPVILIAETPTTVGTLYIYPGTQPSTDVNSIPITGGIAILDAAGDWYIRTTSVGTETLRVIDGGGVGNIGAIAAAGGGTGLASNINVASIGGQAQSAVDVAARFSPCVWGVPVRTGYSAADGAVLAANANRRGLTVYNNSATLAVALTAQSPATDFMGFMVLLPKSGYIWNPNDQVTKTIIRSWGTGTSAADDLMVCEGS